MIAPNTAFCALAGITRYFAVFGGIWRYLAVFGGVWRYLAVFGGIWRVLRNYPSLPALYEDFKTVVNSRRNNEKLL